MDLSPLVGFYAQVPALMLILARVGSMLVSAPVLGAPFVPSTAKALITLAVGLVLLPVAARTPPPPLDFGYLLLLAREVLVGLSFGFVVNLAFHGIRAGGELINRHAGFSAAENFDPESDIGAGPMGDLLHFAVVLLFLGADLHLQLIATLARSFDLIPLGGGVLSPALLPVLDRGIAEMWMVSLALSFPILTAVMLITVAEGVITRAVPQINVMHISFAVKIVVSVMVLYASLPAAVAFMGTVLRMAMGLGDACIMALR